MYSAREQGREGTRTARREGAREDGVTQGRERNSSRDLRGVGSIGGSENFEGVRVHLGC